MEGPNKNKGFTCQNCASVPSNKKVFRIDRAKVCNCSKEPKKPKHSDEVLHLGVIHGYGPNRTRDWTRPDCSRSDRTASNWTTTPDQTGP